MIRPSKSAGRAGDPEAREQAASIIRDHARSHATLFERLERLSARSERLEREGIPSDSATNRALRAESEVHTSLMDLRSSFAASGGDVGAFDLESKRLYPGFEVAENS